MSGYDGIIILNHKNAIVEAFTLYSTMTQVLAMVEVLLQTALTPKKEFVGME